MRVNRQWVLAQRPTGIPDENTFRIEQVPVAEPHDGEVLVRNHYIPVDPGMRPALWADDVGEKVATDAEFSPFPIGGPVGFFTVGQVEQSRHADFAEGEWVTGLLLWQDYAIAPGEALSKIDVTTIPPTAWLGPLGIPGLSAWTGLVSLADLRETDIVVVTSAAGSVGLVAGQIARNRGCTVIGVAGGPEKCAMLTGQYGFDDAIDYKTEPDMAAAMRRACPKGIDVLFENVGNAMIDAAMPIMRLHGRIVICGQTADYNLPPGERPGIRNTDRFVSHRLSMRGLFVFDHAERFVEARAEMAGWLKEGRLSLPETVLEGFENIPSAFSGLFTGQSAGRTIVKIT